jgi:hypothetical protein
MKCLRIILGITKHDHLHNHTIRQKTEQPEIIELIRRSRLRWLGHVMRMQNDRLPPKLLFAQADGKRPRGRPQNAWKNLIIEDLASRGMKLTWFDVVQDRKGWRKVVKGEKVNSRSVRRKLVEAVPATSDLKSSSLSPSAISSTSSTSSSNINKNVERCLNTSTCPLCHKTYFSQFYYFRHINTKHQAQIVVNPCQSDG